MSLLDFADNVVLHLQRGSRSIKVITTGEEDRFKVEQGLADGDSIVDTSYCTYKDARHVYINGMVNGYTQKLNLMFKKGLFGVAKELSNEYEARQKAKETDDGIPSSSSSCTSV